MTIENSLEEDGIHLLGPSSSSFLATARQFFEPAVFSKVGSHLSAGAIITNNASRYIWGFSVVYTYPHWLSPSGHPCTVWINPSASSPHPPTTRMLPPSGSYLVTPIPGVLATRHVDGRVTITPNSGDETQPRRFGVFVTARDTLDDVLEKYAATQEKEAVILTVDSVIFDDGTLIGPDSMGRLREINERIRAEREVAATLKPMRGETLKSKLISYVNDSVRISRAYDERVRGISEALLRTLEDRGEPAVWEEISYLESTRWFSGRDEVRRQ